MAISKIISINRSIADAATKYLKASITYIMNPEKTDNGFLIGSYHCSVEGAADEMLQVKKNFRHTEGRQGYHIVISFKKGETNEDTAYEIVEKFVQKYLGGKYQAVYAVHNNTDAIHGHIIFNSVSFADGTKYRYEKGDWRKEIQPLLNSLCEEKGLATIDVNAVGQVRRQYEEMIEEAGRKSIWKKMIRRDIDAAIVLADDYTGFLKQLSSRGYVIKEGKYLAIKPPGMERFRRTKTLGDEYTEEMIRTRIPLEVLGNMEREHFNSAPRLQRHHYKKKAYRRKLTPLQRYYTAKLYKLGILRRRPYSQAYRYKEDIKRLRFLQEKSLFLLHNKIGTVSDLQTVVNNLTSYRRWISNSKRRCYRDLKEYRDTEQMKKDGYRDSQIEMLIAHTSGQLEKMKGLEKTVNMKMKIAEEILVEIKAEQAARKLQEGRPMSRVERRELKETAGGVQRLLEEEEIRKFEKREGLKMYEMEAGPRRR